MNVEKKLRDYVNSDAYKIRYLCLNEEEVRSILDVFDNSYKDLTINAKKESIRLDLNAIQKPVVRLFSAGSKQFGMRYLKSNSWIGSNPELWIKSKTVLNSVNPNSFSFFVPPIGLYALETDLEYATLINEPERTNKCDVYYTLSTERCDIKCKTLEDAFYILVSDTNDIFYNEVLKKSAQEWANSVEDLIRFEECSCVVVPNFDAKIIVRYGVF